MAGQKRSPTPPSSATTETLLLEQDQPAPVCNASSRAGQSSNPEGATYDKTTDSISRTTPPGVEARHALSSGRLSGLSLVSGDGLD